MLGVSACFVSEDILELGNMFHTCTLVQSVLGLLSISVEDS